jgi:hypothetical protein
MAGRRTGVNLMELSANGRITGAAPVGARGKKVSPRPTPSSQTRASGPQFQSRGGADGSGSRSVPERPLRGRIATAAACDGGTRAHSSSRRLSTVGSDSDRATDGVMSPRRSVWRRGASIAGPVRLRSARGFTRCRSPGQRCGLPARRRSSSGPRTVCALKAWTSTPRRSCCGCCDEVARPPCDGVRVRRSHRHAQRL